MERDYKGYIEFWPEFKKELSKEALDEAQYFIYNHKKILVKIDNEKIYMPTKEIITSLELENSYYLGELEGKPCICGNVAEVGRIEEGYEFVDFTHSNWKMNEAVYFVAIKAMQLMLWDVNTRYCGRCGAPYKLKEDERAKVCEHCGRVEYPRISPAVIVGVYRGEEVLLAHNTNFKKGLYSIIAGFVEQGETLEQAVKREVLEEVGVHIKNIQYMSSRPWSSGDSLMFGFIAEYESGEIITDGVEIEDAGWYTKDHLPPELPLKITTARQIIDYLMRND